MKSVSVKNRMFGDSYQALGRFSDIGLRPRNNRSVRTRQ